MHYKYLLKDLLSLFEPSSFSSLAPSLQPPSTAWFTVPQNFSDVASMPWRCDERLQSSTSPPQLDLPATSVPVGLVSTRSFAPYLAIADDPQRP